jgi:hypothetical protein
MTPETALFLLELLNRQTVNIGAPDFEQSVQIILQAQRELQSLISQNGAKQTAKAT